MSMTAPLLDAVPPEEDIVIIDENQGPGILLNTGGEIHVYIQYICLGIVSVVLEKLLL